MNKSITGLLYDYTNKRILDGNYFIYNGELYKKVKTFKRIDVDIEFLDLALVGKSPDTDKKFYKHDVIEIEGRKCLLDSDTPHSGCWSLRAPSPISFSRNVRRGSTWMIHKSKLFKQKRLGNVYDLGLAELYGLTEEYIKKQDFSYNR